MPIGVAVGTSLVVVAALGATTAGSYALSGYVDWALVAWLAAGGVAGSLAGRGAGQALAARRNRLERGFAAAVIAVGAVVAASAR
ncbi:MAG: TSUP family transporter [Cypionkella sp.]